MAVFFLIPARLGSKGLVRKNLAPIGGKSLLEWAIDSAFESGISGKIVVSSEADEALEIAKSRGAFTHKRTPAAASDEASAADVVLDFLSSWRADPDDIIVYLQPTSPLRTGEHVRDAFMEFERLGMSPLISVRLVSDHPEKMLVIDADGRLQSYGEVGRSSDNRQALSAVWYPNGAIYIFSIQDFSESRSFPTSGSVPFEMSDAASIDVDSSLDLRIAEGLINEQ